ncbi:MAG: PTS fructose transporter subunit IIA [Pseudomonadota bacterium]
MIGLVLVAHAGLAEALLASLEHVVGPLDGVRAISVGPSDDLRSRQAEIDGAVAAVEMGGGVVVLTDMFGGTPSNLAHGAMTRPGVEVIYGANLPLLVKIAKMRDHPLEEAVDAAIEAGRKYVNSANTILAGRSPAQ